MAKSRNTTSGPAERNTPREIVFDMETDITSLEAYTGLLELAAQGMAAGHLTDENKEGLLRLAFDMTDCLEHHRAQYRRLFAAVVQQGEADAEVQP